MNTLLSKHRPKGCSKEDWETSWKNGGHYIAPIVAVLLELRGSDTITEDALNHPNLHDKLIWEASRRRLIDQIVKIIDIKVDNV